MEVDPLWEEFREQLAIWSLDGRHGNISRMRDRMATFFDLHRVCLWCGSDLPKDRRRQWCIDTGCGRQATSRYNWKVIRGAVLKGKCQRCGIKRPSEVHHIVPISDGGHPFDRDNLIGLCRQCHLDAHQEINDKKDTKAARKRRKKEEKAAEKAALKAERLHQADEYWAQFGGIV